MKRIWLGIGVLAALIAVGVWSMFAADAIHGDMARQLHQAAYRTDSRQAFDTSQQVQRQWERYFLFTATMADHTDVDEIDALFAQMEVCRTRGDSRRITRTTSKSTGTNRIVCTGSCTTAEYGSLI